MSHPPSVPPLTGEDHVCPTCPLDFGATTPDDVRVLVAEVPTRARALLSSRDDEAWRVPGPDGSWSAAEYLCHLRDVYVTFTVRLHRARREDGPRLDPMYNDLRAQRFGYARTAPDAALTELAAAAEGFCAEVADTAPSEWDRTVTRLPGEDRTARWLVRQAMHEGVHHVRDVERVGRAVMEGGRP